MNRRLNTIVFLFYAVAVLFVPFSASAIDALDVGPLNILINPENPNPFDAITARVESFRFDLSRSVITWYVNGKKTLSGIGETRASFSVGGGGKETTIDVVAQSESSGVFSTKKTLRPAGVNLLWEADTYAPHFYKGKALASSAAKIKVVAFPELVDSLGRHISAKNLVYQWRVDGTNEAKQSGYGARSINITGARIYGDTEVSVEVSSLDKSIVAKKFLLIPSSDPNLVFYENRPLEGVRYSEALHSPFTLSEREMTIRAEPYFFSDIGTLNYEWSFNNQSREVDRKEWNNITLRQEGDTGGASSVNLSVRGISGIRGRVLQNAGAALLIYFGESASAGSFFGR